MLDNMHLSEEDARRVIESAGFMVLNKTSKVVEYKSNTKDRVIYLRLGQGFPSHADIVVHPEVPVSTLLAIPGVSTNPRVELRFGSNMKAFPKARNTGDAPEHYGRALQAASVEALESLCKAYSLIA